MSVEIATLLNRILDGQSDMKADLATIKNTVTAVQEDLASFKVETNVKLDDHEKRIATLEAENKMYKDKEDARIEEARKADILKQMYDRKWNNLAHGIPEGENETKEDCVKLIKQTLADALKIKEDIVITDCHRLPQKQDGDYNNHPFTHTRSRKKYPRPIIFKVTNAFDNGTIWENVANLKEYNDDARNNGTHTISISKHLPKALQDQRRKLLPELIKAKRKNLYAKIKFDYQKVAMYLDVDS